MVAPLEMHASGFLIVLSQAPKVFTMRVVQGGAGVRELACPRPHDLHGAMVPRGFLNPGPPH
jgi:hypothetical protein